MPIIHIMGSNLNKEQKNVIAAKTYECAKIILKAPNIKTFFNEFEDFYENGEPALAKQFDIIVEGPDIGKENFQTLAERLYQSVADVVADVKDIAIVYHSNDHDHVASNGVLLSNRHKKTDS